MKTLVKADEKGRIPIRGTQKGRQYLVIEDSGGWWVTPAPDLRPPKKSRRWDGPSKDLVEHLQGMADLGFAFESSKAARKPPGACRF